jgi:hypothetical protein
MNNGNHDFVSVDMRGLKAALVARARMQRVSVSVVVRAAVARELGVTVAGGTIDVDAVEAKTPTHMVKLSIRLRPAEAQQFAACARAAGLSHGAYLAGLVANVPLLTGGGKRDDHLAALVQSSAELAILSRNIRHLASLLREGEVRAAQEYRGMLDQLAVDVGGHLHLAARALADLQPKIYRR